MPKTYWPLSPMQEHILLNLQAGRHHAAGIIQACPCRRSAASAALYGLVRRGLVEPLSGRWMLTIAGVMAAHEITLSRSN